MNRFWLLTAALAPLLGATATITQAIAIALCALLLISLHTLLMAPLRRHLDSATRLWASLVLAATLATCLQLGLRAWALPLALQLGHYPALLALTCVIADALLPQQGRWRTLLGAFASLVAACVALGICRQLLASQLGLHIATLAPGALILLGLLLGLYNHLRPKPSTRHQGTP